MIEQWDNKEGRCFNRKEKLAHGSHQQITRLKSFRINWSKWISLVKLTQTNLSCLAKFHNWLNSNYFNQVWEEVALLKLSLNSNRLHHNSRNRSLKMHSRKLNLANSQFSNSNKSNNNSSNSDNKNQDSSEDNSNSNNNSSILSSQKCHFLNTKTLFSPEEVDLWSKAPIGWKMNFLLAV